MTKQAFRHDERTIQMNENEILEKLQEAQKDQNFVDELNAQTTAEGLQKV